MPLNDRALPGGAGSGPVTDGMRCQGVGGGVLQREGFLTQLLDIAVGVGQVGAASAAFRLVGVSSAGSPCSILALRQAAVSARQTQVIASPWWMPGSALPSTRWTLRTWVIVLPAKGEALAILARYSAADGPLTCSPSSRQARSSG
jgi:hypothetical protein